MTAPMNFHSGPRDWPEDAKHDNGSYSCRCHKCGEQFVGLKRRITCKLCAGEPVMPQHGVVQNTHWGTVVDVAMPYNTPIVVVPVDPVSWHAMVERAAQIAHGGTPGERWVDSSDDDKEWYRDHASDILRAALNRPDGWTP